MHRLKFVKTCQFSKDQVLLSDPQLKTTMFQQFLSMLSPVYASNFTFPDYLTILNILASQFHIPDTLPHIFFLTPPLSISTSPGTKTSTLEAHFPHSWCSSTNVSGGDWMSHCKAQSQQQGPRKEKKPKENKTGSVSSAAQQHTEQQRADVLQLCRRGKPRRPRAAAAAPRWTEAAKHSQAQSETDSPSFVTASQQKLHCNTQTHSGQEVTVKSSVWA